MIVYPESCLKDLEFDKLLLWLHDRVMSEATSELISQQAFMTDQQAIEHALILVEEYRSALTAGHIKGWNDFESADDILDQIKPANKVVALEEVLVIKRLIEIHASLRSSIGHKDHFELYTHILDILDRSPVHTALVKEMERIFDETGEVRDNASPELSRIRKNKQKVASQIERAFESVIRKFKAQDVLLDSPESFKNGRRVLAVKAEHKRSVTGIMHDQSATGQTAYIEPEEIVLLNNNLFDLESDERKEIYKILLALCDEIRFVREDIYIVGQLLSELDFIRVKAELAKAVEGSRPEVVNEPHIHWVTARHPLLKLKNDQLKKRVIPADIQLHGKNKMMVISGPNAGGKSIALKTTGLLQLMLQFGMLPPCDATSKVGIFSRLMVDIGDQQSIENDLSTYSSRLQKMVFMMDHVDEGSLVLIDEFGSGTDPTTGGALAEAILRHLLYKKCWGVVTTHYSNLKVFAFKTRGIVNASMSFDMETISPTYTLSIGKPGSSFAFEIAEKMKVPDVVLKNARRRLGEKQVKVEDLLISIQSEKQGLEEKIAALESRQADLDKLIKNYETLSGELEYKRKKLRLQAKEERISRESEFNRRLEKTIREIQESKNLEKAKALASEKREERETIMEEVANLQRDIIKHETVDERAIQTGDHVRMKNGNVTGEVMSIEKKKAKVSFGAMVVETPLKDLRLVGAPLKVNPTKSIQTNIFDRTANFKTRLDIRGLKMEEAINIVQAYLDEAMVVGVDRLEIIHGRGTGVLKRIVRDKAKEYSRVDRISHPDPESGGDGVSILHLK